MLEAGKTCSCDRDPDCCWAEGAVQSGRHACCDELPASDWCGSSAGVWWLTIHTAMFCTAGGAGAQTAGAAIHLDWRDSQGVSAPGPELAYPSV
jgi:hypothetical protein